MADPGSREAAWFGASARPRHYALVGRTDSRRFVERTGRGLRGTGLRGELGLQVLDLLELAVGQGHELELDATLLPFHQPGGNAQGHAFGAHPDLDRCSWLKAAFGLDQTAFAAQGGNLAWILETAPGQHDLRIAGCSPPRGFLAVR